MWSFLPVCLPRTAKPDPSGRLTGDHSTVAGTALALDGMFHPDQIPSLRHDAWRHSHLICLIYSVPIIQQKKSTNCVTDWSLDANYLAIPKGARNQQHLPGPQIAINRAFGKICVSRLPLWRGDHEDDAPCWYGSFETESFHPEFLDLRVSAPFAIVRFVDAETGRAAPAMRYLSLIHI